MDELGHAIIQSTIEQASSLMRESKAQHLILYRFKPEEQVSHHSVRQSSLGRSLLERHIDSEMTTLKLKIARHLNATSRKAFSILSSNEKALVCCHKTTLHFFCSKANTTRRVCTHRKACDFTQSVGVAVFDTLTIAPCRMSLTLTEEASPRTGLFRRLLASTQPTGETVRSYMPK